ncbi:MAG: hypothetical protein ACO1N0_15860 [Fluviicola sp.]
MKIFLKWNRWAYIAPFALYFIPFSPLKEIFAVVGSLMIFLWLYAVSIVGQLQLIRENLPSSNIKLFKIVFGAVPFVFLINYLIGNWLLDMNNAIGVVLFGFLVLATIFSVFYLYYFTAKTIATIDKRRNVSLDECYYYFLLIGLSGLGVFLLQPKIQKLISINDSK